MKEILHEIGLELLVIVCLVVGPVILTLIFGAILHVLRLDGKWEKFMDWLSGPPARVLEKDFWCEHEDRTWIREKRRQLRPAFVLGLILLAGCLAAGRFELPDWFGVVYVLAAFMGLGLVISPGLELLSLRRDEKDLKRRLMMLHPATPSEVQRESVAATPLAR